MPAKERACSPPARGTRPPELGAAVTAGSAGRAGDRDEPGHRGRYTRAPPTAWLPDASKPFRVISPHTSR
jgi:hypothetical protein